MSILSLLSNLLTQPSDTPVNQEVDALKDYKAECDKFVTQADKQLDQLIDRHKLSGQEFDKQIVALSGGGLGLTITLTKDILQKGNEESEWVLYLCWFLFVVSLTINLISHRLASTHYNLMIERLGHIREATSKYEVYQVEYVSALTKKIDRLTPRLDLFNTVSLSSCLIGIALFVIFIVYNKYHHDDRLSGSPTASATNVSTRSDKRLASDSLAPKPSVASSTSASSGPHSANGARKQIDSTPSRHTQDNINGKTHP